MNSHKCRINRALTPHRQRTFNNKQDRLFTRLFNLWICILQDRRGGLVFCTVFCTVCQPSVPRSLFELSPLFLVLAVYLTIVDTSEVDSLRLPRSRSSSVQVIVLMEAWEVSHAIAPPNHLVITTGIFVIRNKRVMVSILLHAQIEHSIDAGAYDRQSSTPVTTATAKSLRLVPRISVVCRGFRWCIPWSAVCR